MHHRIETTFVDDSVYLETDTHTVCSRVPCVRKIDAQSKIGDDFSRF